MRICDIMVERLKMYLALFLDNFNLGQAQFNNLCGACNRLNSDRLNASLDLLHGANRLSGEHRSLKNDGGGGLQTEEVCFPHRLHGRKVTVDQLAFGVSADVDVCSENGCKGVRDGVAGAISTSSERRT